MDNWILTKFNSRWIYISVKVYWNDSKSSNYMWLLQILVYAWSHWWLWPLREFTVLARKYTFSPATWICGNITTNMSHPARDSPVWSWGCPVWTCRCTWRAWISFCWDAGCAGTRQWCRLQTSPLDRTVTCITDAKHASSHKHFAWYDCVACMHS